MQTGDLVCVILGPKTPLVLRPEAKTDGEREKYKLAGHT